MKVSTQSYKGARDFYPEDKALQKWLFAKWRIVLEKYGYVEYDAPILEPTELYLMKGNEEIVKEQTYTFEDRGGRSVTVRTEMTPSVSRMVAARRQELAYPLRWYSFPNLWRYERMQKGRLREFWQPNVDLFGVSSIYGEFEMIQIIDELVQTFGASRESYVIKVNSRQLVNAMLEKTGLDTDKQLAVIRLIDKMNKMPADEFTKNLVNVAGNDAAITIQEFLKIKTVQDIPDYLAQVSAVDELKTLFSLLANKGVSNAVFDVTVMRGFDYYTDIVFEVFDADPSNPRAMMGGGRYDGLVGQFGVEPIPTIGFAWGDVVFSEFLKSNSLVPEMDLPLDITILPTGAELFDQATKIANKLRDDGLNVAVDYSGRKLDKQLKNADKSGVSYVLIIGEDEIKSNIFTLRNLTNGNEQKIAAKEILTIVSQAD